MGGSIFLLNFAIFTKGLQLGKTFMQDYIITRKNLVSSLLAGLAIGAVVGAPLGWFAHRFYADQRYAQTLICRERNRDKPLAVVESICGSRF